VEETLKGLLDAEADQICQGVSRLYQKLYRHVVAWRNRQIVGEFHYVYLDGVILKRSWAGEERNISVLVAIGVATDGYRSLHNSIEVRRRSRFRGRGDGRCLVERWIKRIRGRVFV
jgi:putative transposase